AQSHPSRFPGGIWTLLRDEAHIQDMKPSRIAHAPAQAPPLPSAEPIALIDRTGRRTGESALAGPDQDVLIELLRRMVVGRRSDRQAGALARQGRLAVYPPSHGQQACRVGAAPALAGRHVLCPTYRPTLALAPRSG